MDFIAVAAIIAMVMLVWDCFEVGRNDASNLVNAVFGARVLRRKKAVLIAGIFVVLGATFSSPVMDTVRKGIFDLPALTPEMAVSIFLSAYIVDTILLHGYSSFGMPVSTTATLVFSLAGGAFFVAGTPEVVHWGTLGKVVGAIIASVFLSGIAGFLAQRIFRGVMRHKVGNHFVVTLHGPWITGAILTLLSWFMIVKGLKAVPLVKEFKETIFDAYGAPVFLLAYWGALTLATHLVLNIMGRRASKYLFHFTSVVGMACLAFAFGQNDLANAASPGLSALWIWRDGQTAAMDIPRWVLFVCGFLMFLGMTTKRAQRVTRAQVNTASEFDKVSLYAPEWCKAAARVFLKNTKKERVLAQRPRLTPDGQKKVHYDTLRASTIMMVSASVIAFASGLGIPVSTTYVGFAAVVSTGWADRVYGRGDADLKMGRAIWTVTAWFFGALIAAVATGLVAKLVHSFEIVGIAIALSLNLTIRYYVSKRSDKHEKDFHKDSADAKSGVAIDYDDDDY